MVAKAIPPLPSPHKWEDTTSPSTGQDRGRDWERTGAAARSGSQVSISRPSLARSWPRPVEECTYCSSCSLKSWGIGISVVCNCALLASLHHGEMLGFVVDCQIALSSTYRTCCTDYILDNLPPRRAQNPLTRCSNYAVCKIQDARRKARGARCHLRPGASRLLGRVSAISLEVEGRLTFGESRSGRPGFPGRQQRGIAKRGEEEPKEKIPRKSRE